MFNAAAARNLHAYHSHALNVIFRDDLCQLFGIIHLVQLGASDDRDFVFDEVIMKAAVGISCTVGCYEQIGAVKVWGMLLAEGRLHIQKEDYWGNLSILNEIRPGEMFGESYAALDSGALMYDVAATEESVVLLFDMERILSVCPSACSFHTRLVKNLFYMISEKNRSLVQKLGHMSQRSTREKLLSYLSDEARRQNSSSFVISFNRQQLADFLSVDRSAMSNELGKMRKEGILDFHKNEFTLYVENVYQ